MPDNRPALKGQESDAQPLERIDRVLAKANNWLGRLYSVAEAHFAIFLVVVFLVSCAIHFSFASYQCLLTEDSYCYLLKAIEIGRGDFVPIRTHAIGWSLFLAPFMMFRQEAPIYDHMMYARMISSVVSAACIFPFVLVAQRFLERKILVTVTLLYVVCLPLIISGISVYTEPLFTFLLLTALNLIFAAQRNPVYWLVAAAVGAAMFCVRPNGVLIIAVLVLCFLMDAWQQRRLRWGYLIGMVAVFALASSPFLLQRAYHFGGPMNFGANNKYFVDNPLHAWADNVPAPSFMDYVRTHTVADFFDKFVLNGFVKVIYTYAYASVNAFLLPFVCFGLLTHAFRRKSFPLLAVFVIWIAGFSIVYHVFGSPRYLRPTIPLMLLFAGLGIGRLTQDRRDQHICLAILLLVALLHPLASFRTHFRGAGAFVKIEEDGRVWADWAANNVKGKIAIIEGGDLIMMNLPDARIGDRGLVDLVAPESGVSIIRPGWFDDVGDTMTWLRQQDVTHMALDELNLFRRPALGSIAHDAHAGRVPYLQTVYTNFDTDSNWKIEFFRIDWDAFDEYQSRRSNEIGLRKNIVPALSRR